MRGGMRGGARGGVSGAAMPSQPIRFILNGVPHQAAGVDPHTSLLQYLREQLHLTGTKEGCAEGDCGACTVVVGELCDGPDGGGESGAAPRVNFKPVNACIRALPTLDGRAVMTVEGLAQADGSLHPVQQAMVDCHASQCGFCTPGFVMSLFALVQHTSQPTRAQTVEALAGNLCRCTGYRPILDAAAMLRARGDAPGGLVTAAAAATPECGAALARALIPLQRTEDFSYSAHGVTFHAPRSIASFSRLAAAHPDAWILAGGTDVGLWINKALQSARMILSTGAVAGLGDVTERAGWLDIGAAVPLDDAFTALNRHYPEYAHLWQRFASPPIRASGTLGGNIANGSPIGDAMPLLMVLGSEVVLRHGDATRTLPLEDLYLDYKKQARAPGEWVERVRIPVRDSAPVPALEVAAYKLAKRNEQDISAVCLAIALRRANGKVVSVRIALGGMAGIPKRAAHTETALTGQSWNEAAVQAALNAMPRDFAPLTDMRASAAYRMRAAQNLLLRFYYESVGGAAHPVAHPAAHTAAHTAAPYARLETRVY